MSISLPLTPQSFKYELKQDDFVYKEPVTTLAALTLKSVATVIAATIDFELDPKILFPGLNPSQAKVFTIVDISNPKPEVGFWRYKVLPNGTPAGENAYPTPVRSGGIASWSCYDLEFVLFIDNTDPVTDLDLLLMITGS